jgi:hypothetical protein
MCLLLGVCMRIALKAVRTPSPGADRPFCRIRPSPPIVLLSTNRCSFSTPSPILKILCVPSSPNMSPSRGLRARSTQRRAGSDSGLWPGFDPLHRRNQYNCNEMILYLNSAMAMQSATVKLWSILMLRDAARTAAVHMHAQLWHLNV